MSRRKFTSKFKTKVVLEALKEHSTKAELAKKYKLAPQQIGQWKREFLAGAESIFGGPSSRGKKTDDEIKEEKLFKIIGQQKVDIDFLKNALR